MLALCCNAGAAPLTDSPAHPGTATDGGTGIDLGVAGRLYPITEPDLLQYIRDRLLHLHDSGEWQQFQLRSQRRARAYASRPPGITLPRAQQARVRYLDPALRLSRDLYDAKGRILFFAGTVVNPLQQRALNRPLVFFDGTDPLQRRWVREQFLPPPGEPLPKLILSAGEPVALSTDWERPVYFDQRQVLIHRLGIEALPSVVRQQGLRLRIEEVVLDAR